MKAETSLTVTECWLPSHSHVPGLLPEQAIPQLVDYIPQQPLQLRHNESSMNVASGTLGRGVP